MTRSYLIVDDSPVIRATLQKLLEKVGVGKDNVRAVASGTEALATVQEWHPQVVLMDIQMPGMDGEQAATLMLNEDPELKIVILTGLDRGDPRAQHLVSLGAYSFLPKPVRTEDVQALVRLLDREETGAGRIR